MQEQEIEAGDAQEEPEDDNAKIEELSAASGEPTTVDGQSPQEGRDGDALAWLEGPAFNAPIEEMPTLQWPEIYPEHDAGEGESTALGSEQSDIETGPTHNQVEEPLDNLEDAMDWLEQLAAGQGTPLDEMPTLISGGQYDEIAPADTIMGPELNEITGPTGTLPDYDSDPMAWLEQLAVDQSSPLEELPSVADRLLASEIISQNDVDPDIGSPLTESILLGIEVDEALIYLEQLALSNGIALDQIDLNQMDLEDLPESDLTAIDQLAVAKSAAAVQATEAATSTEGFVERDWNDLTDEIPDDPDQALAWLGGLANDEPLLEEFSAVPDDKPVTESRSKAAALDVETLDEMPDDPDAAMAWMMGLAERQEELSDPSTTHETDDKPSEVRQEAEQTPSREERLDSEVLDSARLAVSTGELDKATEIYHELLESGRGGSELINDLESAVSEQPNSPDLIRLLGDAYMQDGQMQKALKTYRKGFDHL